MRTQTEADKTFLELVQGSLQASAKEAERIATFTGTRLVRIDSAQPAAPKELLPLLSKGSSRNHKTALEATFATVSANESRLELVQEEVTGRMLSILLREMRQRPGQQIPTDLVMKICVAKIEKPLAKAVGGKGALLELAAKLVDSWLEAGIFVQVETAKKVMLRLNNNRN